MGAIVDGGSVEPRLTVDGLREMVSDLVRAGHRPAAILLSEYDRRSVIEDLCSASVREVTREDEARQAQMIAVIGGVPVLSSADISRGKCRVLLRET